ncbi:uncharacterized protein B0I36DRAFT_308885 [Microdochium trichocladiopsis]|uniref:Heterokaryon incompatibility domain-containing protein n=1 Tax=Microdochium trichocladiopsis TaxID=1682393 RepID=A0A9P8YGF8_9PEZI|nr:uncharacterized protein B0I36DRAFT_308885 [Microdochium trichocladiopsis]KAH7039547.1 hypothetical protein B0I36DRAFT_308885 [Microdochium trichocladiopsis]
MCGGHVVDGQRFHAAFLLYQLWMMQRPRAIAGALTRRIWWPWNMKKTTERTLAAVRADDALTLSVRAAMTLGTRRKMAGESRDLASNLLRSFIPGTGGSTLQATVDKDRIYGLKAISADFDSLRIPIEYDDNLLTHEQLFATATKAMVQQNGQVGLLVYSTGLRARSTTLPSWCPDYTKPLPRSWAGTREDDLYNAARACSGGMPSGAHHQLEGSTDGSDPRLLHLDASFFSRIVQTGHPPRPVASDRERHFLNIATICAVMAAANCARAYPSEVERQRGAWCIPIFDRELNDIGQLVRATDRAKVEHDRLMTWMKGSWSRLYKPPVWPAYWGSLSDEGQIPVPIELETGHIGMFEDVAEAEAGEGEERSTLRIASGDEIWVPRGSHVPFAFRPLNSGHYQCLGPAYVYGVMNGELIGIEPFSTIVLE